MKILTSSQTREADAFTMLHEPVASIDLMERAAKSCADWLLRKYPGSAKLAVFCGQGNNGGDGLVVARKWLEAGRDVDAIILQLSEKGSADFEENLNRLVAMRASIAYLKEGGPVPDLMNNTLVVDAIFGTGLNRPVIGFPAEIIQKINYSDAEVISIDIPSGLFADHDTPKEGAVVNAAHTLTFELPKLALLLPGPGSHVGAFTILPIGLHQEYIIKAETENFYVDSIEKYRQLLLRSRFDHKGTFGHVLIIAGSYGKMGAAVLSSRAAMRAGAGLVTAFVPKCGYEVFQTSVPEVMCLTSPEEKTVVQFPDTEKFDTVAIGPGIGTDKKTINAFEEFLEKYPKPIVVDADALNILSIKPELLQALPIGSILTPHPGEFKRIFGDSGSDFERLEILRKKAVEYKCYILLKGAHSALATPEGKVYFNSTGNNGMATAGSGDTLTGIIASFLAQTNKPFESALMGMFIHGLAGDLASEDLGAHGMIAGDIVDYLPLAIKSVLE